MHLHQLLRIAMVTIVLGATFSIGQHYTSAAAQDRPTWEYRLIKITVGDKNADGTHDLKGMDNLAANGWEAVSTNESWVLIKRRK